MRQDWGANFKEPRVRLTGTQLRCRVSGSQFAQRAQDLRLRLSRQALPSRLPRSPTPRYNVFNEDKGSLALREYERAGGRVAERAPHVALASNDPLRSRYADFVSTELMLPLRSTSARGKRPHPMPSQKAGWLPTRKRFALPSRSIVIRRVPTQREHSRARAQTFRIRFHLDRIPSSGRKGNPRHDNRRFAVGRID